MVIGGSNLNFDGIEDSSINISGTTDLTLDLAGGDANIDFTALNATTTQVSGNSFPRQILRTHQTA